MSSNPSPSDLGINLPLSKVWTESERAHALAVYAETNSVREASRESGIPVSTIHSWISTEAGAQSVERLRTYLREHVAWKHAQTVLKGLNLLHKRMDIGDEHVLPNGNIVYKAVSARDLMMIIAVSQDKHANMVGQLDSGRNVDAALSSLASKLMDKLAEAKAQHNQGPKPITQATDASEGYIG